MLQIENTFFELGESCSQDCLIICDRGAMDAAACNIKVIYTILQILTIIPRKYHNETVRNIYSHMKTKGTYNVFKNNFI